MLKNEPFNILEIARKSKFKRFAYFQVTLRDKIKYDIELIDGYIKFTNDEKNKPKRHAIFCCQTYFRNDQLVPPRFNSSFFSYKPEYELYSYETTVIDILLECSDSDFKKMSLDLKSKANEMYLYELLEFFAYKYNLATSGIDFLDVAELFTGSFKCFLYYNSKKIGKYELGNAIISPSLSIINSDSNPKLNLQTVINIDIPPWKYFVNKTKFDYIIYNNLDCVINAAISFESYIISIIKNNKKYDDYKKTYKKQLGFKNALQYCVDNGIINEEFFDKCNDAYEKISLNRSLIIHGAIDTPIIGREQAQKAYDTVVDFFSKIDE